MNKKNLMFAFAIALATANGFAEMTAHLSQVKIVKNGDQELRQSADLMKPGEIIEYTVVYINPDKATVKNLKATLPVPAGMEFMPATAAPKEVEVSTDGTTFGKFPILRKEKDRDGKEVEKPVRLSEYRFLRWSLGDLNAGSSKTVAARMKLNDVPPVSAAKTMAPSRKLTRPSRLNFR